MAENSVVHAAGGTRSGKSKVPGERLRRASPILALPLQAVLLPFVPVAPSAAQETWTATATAAAPSPRHLHTAVWTGSKMIVWGGGGSFPPQYTGGIYDPAADTWRRPRRMHPWPAALTRPSGRDRR